MLHLGRHGSQALDATASGGRVPPVTVLASGVPPPAPAGAPSAPPPSPSGGLPAMTFQTYDRACAELRDALTAFHLGTGAFDALGELVTQEGTLDAMLRAVATWWAAAAEAPLDWPTAPPERSVTYALLRVALVSFAARMGLEAVIACPCDDPACEDRMPERMGPEYLVSALAYYWHALSGCRAHAPSQTDRANAAPQLGRNRAALARFAVRLAALSADEQRAIAAAATQTADACWGQEARQLAGHGFAAWFGAGIVREPAIEAVRRARDLTPRRLSPAEHAAVRAAIDDAAAALALTGLADVRVTEALLLPFADIASPT